MGKKVKVVFDTNVWVSILMDGVLYDKYSHVKEDLTVYTSKDILVELTKVLLYPKIAKVLSKNGISTNEVIRVISCASRIVDCKVKLHVIEADEEDNKILECALASKADAIISGDKHLLELVKFKKTKILSPREFFNSFI